MAVDPNQHDQFVLRQRIRPVINHYEFSVADDEPPFCFVEQKRFTFKEDIRFYADDSKSVELMRIKGASDSTRARRTTSRVPMVHGSARSARCSARASCGRRTR